MDPKPGESLRGALSAGSAFVIWGLLPIFWKLLQSVNSFELVLHRVVWSFVFLLVLMKIRGRFGVYLNAFRNKRLVAIHSLGGVLLVINWMAFIYAVTHDQVLQASLAYFMVPLVNTALGFVVLNERLSKLRAAAVLLAAVGVLNEILQVDEVPWFALTIAASFGAYGLLKKKTSLGSVTGLSVENTVIFPVALGCLVVLFLNGEGALGHESPRIQGIILSIGVVGTIPLLMFSYGAARIDLNTLGILQFIAPLMKFLLAVWLFNEQFSSEKLITFVCIWVGLALYLWDSFHAVRIKEVHPDL